MENTRQVMGGTYEYEGHSMTSRQGQVGGQGKTDQAATEVMVGR